MSKIGSFFGKIGSWIVANKAKAIVLGSVATLAIGTTATGVALTAGHDHTPLPAITENYIGATCEKNGSYDEVIYCSGCGEEMERNTVVLESSGHPAIDALLEKLNTTLSESNSETDRKLEELKSEYQAKIDALAETNASTQKEIDSLDRGIFYGKKRCDNYK